MDYGTKFVANTEKTAFSLFIYKTDNQAQAIENTLPDGIRLLKLPFDIGFFLGLVPFRIRKVTASQGSNEGSKWILHTNKLQQVCLYKIFISKEITPFLFNFPGFLFRN